MSYDEYISEIADTCKDVDTSGAIFRDRVFTMGEVLTMLNDGKLRFIEAKRDSKWDKRRLNNAVESILMGIPPAQLIIDGSTATWYVLEGDGFYRACLQFYTGKSRLENSVVYDNAFFPELPRRLRERFINLKVTASVISPGCTKVDRLWAYRATMLRQYGRVSLIDCLIDVDSAFAEKVRWLCTRCEINDIDTLLNVMVGYGFADTVADTGSTNDRRLEFLPYDIFGCMFLERAFKVLKADDKLAVQVGETARVCTEFLSEISMTNNISPESRISLTIAFVTCLAQRIKPEHDFSFSNIRLDSINRTVGNYIKKASAIYHKII